MQINKANPPNTANRLCVMICYNVFTLLMVLGLPDGAFSQECTPWFPFQEGSQFEYSFFDKRDKRSSRIEYEVVERSSEGDETKYLISSKMYDKKDKEVGSFDFSVSCEDGSYHANVSNFMNPQLKEMFGTVELKVSGEELVIPSSLSVGQDLPDAKSIVQAEMGVVNMKIEMEISNRKVIDRAQVETPLQTFDTYKITSTEHIKMPLMNRTLESVYYYAEGYGQVKSETYDKKGRLDSYMLLTKFKK